MKIKSTDISTYMSTYIPTHILSKAVKARYVIIIIPTIHIIGWITFLIVIIVAYEATNSHNYQISIIYIILHSISLEYYYHKNPYIESIILFYVKL